MLVCTALLACLLAPSGASAARNLEVSIMDDQLLFGATSQAQVDRQMALFRRLGIDRVRVSAFWRDHAPSPESTSKPAGFDAGSGYSGAYNFATLDRVLGSAAAHDLRVMLSVSTPAPSWAAGDALGRPGLRKPRPAEFGLFAQALAQRYSRAVDHYAISNEPNQPGWLMPQSDSRGFFAPHHYRRMVQAAYPRIKGADPDSVVLIGELSSTGRVGTGRSKSIRPLAFLRAMACLDRRYRRVRSGRCRNFEPVPADAVGHHPYAFFTLPTARSAHRDDAAIGDGRRLIRVLDRLRAQRALRRPDGKRLNVYYTEFGYQTDPPDPFAGIPLARQNRYLQLSAYLAWRTPRIREINQFRLTDGEVYDEPGPARYREFQSGILFANRSEKPAYRSFPNPFVISKGRFWGHVRPGTDHVVRIQRRRAGGPFRTIRRARTDRRGFFSLRMRARRGRDYRYLYEGGRSSTVRVR